MEEMIAITRNFPKVACLLKSCPLEVIEQMELVRFSAKKFQLDQGEKYNSVYIIVSGNVKVFVMNQKGKQITLDIYGQGNFIGEHEAIVKKPFSASLCSITEVQLLKIPVESFLRWLKLDNAFCQKLTESLCEQLYELTNRAAKYSLNDVRTQVLSTILVAYQQENQQQIAKKQLLDSVSATSRSVYRTLQQLSEEGLIAIESERISILDIDELRKSIEEERI